MPMYLCESGGARILKFGQGIVNVGTNYQLDVTTEDDVPYGPVADVAYRSIDVVLVCTAGYHVGVTPILDGVNQSEQTFSGATVGTVQLQAFFAKRGTRIAARVRTLSRAGDIELQDIAHSHVLIRQTP